MSPGGGYSRLRRFVYLPRRTLSRPHYPAYRDGDVAEAHAKMHEFLHYIHLLMPTHGNAHQGSKKSRGSVDASADQSRRRHGALSRSRPGKRRPRRALPEEPREAKQNGVYPFKCPSKAVKMLVLSVA